MIGYSREENLDDARRAASMFLALDSLPGAADRPHPRRGARRRRRPRRRLRRRRRGRRRGVRVHRSRARHPAGDDLAVRRPQDRHLGRARAVPERRAILGGARAGDRPRARGRRGRAARSGRRSSRAALPQGGAVGRRRAPSDCSRDVYGRRPADVLALTVDAIATQRVSRRGPGRPARVPREAPAGLGRERPDHDDSARPHRQSRRDRPPGDSHVPRDGHRHGRRLLRRRRAGAVTSRGGRGGPHRAGAGDRELSEHSDVSSTRPRARARTRFIRATDFSPRTRRSPRPARPPA